MSADISAFYFKYRIRSHEHPKSSQLKQIDQTTKMSNQFKKLKSLPSSTSTAYKVSTPIDTSRSVSTASSNAPAAHVQYRDTPGRYKRLCVEQVRDTEYRQGYREGVWRSQGDAVNIAQQTPPTFFQASAGGWSQNTQHVEDLLKEW